MLTKPLREGRPRRYRDVPGVGFTEIDPIDESTAAALDRIADATYANESRYFDLLREILEGATPDAAELGRLKAALGKSDTDLESDLQDRAAMLADEKESARVTDEQDSIMRKIAEQERLIEEARVEEQRSCQRYNELDAEIRAAHAKVAVQEKAEQSKVLAANRASIAAVENAKAEIHQLQARLDNTRPGVDHVASLRSRRGLAKQREDDADHARAMAPYIGNLPDELPGDMLSSIVSPPPANGPPVSDVCGRGVRLGQIDGQEVVVAVGKLG